MAGKIGRASVQTDQKDSKGGDQVLIIVLGTQVQSAIAHDKQNE
jgi:hypothetical protein